MSHEELHQQITAYVDDRIDPAENRARIEEHIRYCPECRERFEQELATKMMVRERMPRVAAPDALRSSIASELDREVDQRTDAPRRTSAEEKWTFNQFALNLFSRTGVVVAVIAVLVGAWLLVGERREAVITVGTPPPSAQVAAKPEAVNANFINVAAEQFQGLIEKKLAISHPTEDQADLLGLFQAEGLSYAVPFRSVRASLTGGNVVKVGNGRVAQWAYLRGDTTAVLFMAAPIEALKAGNSYSLSPDALKKLEGGETIWQEFGLNAEAVVYDSKTRTVSCIVANTRPQELKAIVPGL